jgi:hypothetical protein
MRMMTISATRRRRSIGAPRLAAITLMLAAVPSVLQADYRYDDPDPDPVENPTFARDIMPILQESCQSCHQPLGIAPMSLLSYEEVRPWAAVIKDRVVRRQMPPWHVDPSVGIQEFKNDISLSDAEIETIVRWVDGGAPMGDPADLPPPVEWPDNSAWQLPQVYPEFGEPDLVIRSSPYTVLPNGTDQWHEPRIPFEGPSESRWLRAAEIKPSAPLGVQVLHHGHAMLSSPGMSGSRGLVRHGVGKNWDILPPDVGMRVTPEGTIAWSLHYFPIGEEIPDDVVEVGLWFHPPDHEPETETVGEQRFLIDSRLEGMRRATDFVLPPHSTSVHQGIHVVQQPARIHSIRGHMHLRGKAQSIEAIYPDGRRELLNRINFYHNWHTTYLYEDHVAPLLPSGTMLVFHSYHDNTADNPFNPDPDQWVVFGERSVDEMSHMWIGITYFEQEQFDKLVAEREALQRQRQLAGQQETG